MPIQRYYGKSNGVMYPSSNGKGWCKGDEVAELEASRENLKASVSQLREYVSNLERLFGGAEIVMRERSVRGTEHEQTEAHDWLVRYESVHRVGERDEEEPLVWQAVFDKYTLDVCNRAHGKSDHEPILGDVRERCRCFKVPSKSDQVRGER